MSTYHLVDAVIGKRDSIADTVYSEEINANQDIATTGVSTAKKGANQAEKEVQAAVKHNNQTQTFKHNQTLFNQIQ